MVAVSDVATHASDALDAKGGQVMDAYSRFTEECRTHVRDNPIAALGVAAVIGFLLGRLLSAR